MKDNRRYKKWTDVENKGTIYKKKEEIQSDLSKLVATLDILSIIWLSCGHILAIFPLIVVYRIRKWQFQEDKNVIISKWHVIIALFIVCGPFLFIFWKTINKLDSILKESKKPKA